MNLKDYEVSVMHDTAGTMNLTVSNFTVNGKSYNYDSSAISVTFTKSEPVLNSNVQLNLYLMHKSVKISTEAASQVVKDEFPSTFYLSNLMQKITKYNENLDSYEDYSEEEITLVDGTIDYHLPVGSYLIYLSGDRDTAGTSLTFKGSYEVNVTDINGGYSNSDHMYVSGLTESVINTMQDYDNQFVNGESKDFTLIDILTDVDNNPILNSGYFFNILSYDVLSSSIESVTVRYYLTAFQPSKFYGIIFNSNLSAKVEVKLPSLNSPLSYDVNQGESLIVQEQYEIHAGEHIIDITISNVEYSGNDLQYEISGAGPFGVWTTDPSGSGGTSGNVSPIGPEATIKTIKIRE
jgi:hypothetical protein